MSYNSVPFSILGKCSSVILLDSSKRELRRIANNGIAKRDHNDSTMKDKRMGIHEERSINVSKAALTQDDPFR